MKSPNDITSSDLVAIGSIGKSHGLKGSFFLNSYCDPEDNFFTYKRFFLIQKKKILEFSIKSKHIKSSKNIINITGIESVEDIKKLRDKWNKDYKFDFIPVLNMEPEDSNWQGGRGLVTDYFENEIIKKDNIDVSNWQGYLCGPPPMIDAACEVLEKNGIKSDEIFYDKFTDSRDL